MHLSNQSLRCHFTCLPTKHYPKTHSVADIDKISIFDLIISKQTLKSFCRFRWLGRWKSIVITKFSLGSCLAHWRSCKLTLCFLVSKQTTKGMWSAGNEGFRKFRWAHKFSRFRSKTIVEWWIGITSCMHMCIMHVLVISMVYLVH